MSWILLESADHNWAICDSLSKLAKMADTRHQLPDNESSAQMQE